MRVRSHNTTHHHHYHKQQKKATSAPGNTPGCSTRTDANTHGLLPLRCDNSSPARFADACDAWLTTLKGASSTYTPGAELDVVASSVVLFAGNAARCLAPAAALVFDGYYPDGYTDVCATA